jgi:hypothetical protein
VSLWASAAPVVRGDGRGGASRRRVAGRRPVVCPARRATPGRGPEQPAWAAHRIADHNRARGDGRHPGPGVVASAGRRASMVGTVPVGPRFEDSPGAGGIYVSWPTKLLTVVSDQESGEPLWVGRASARGTSPVVSRHSKSAAPRSTLRRLLSFRDTGKYDEDEGAGGAASPSKRRPTSNFAAGGCAW